MKDLEEKKQICIKIAKKYLKNCSEEKFIKEVKKANGKEMKHLYTFYKSF